MSRRPPDQALRRLVADLAGFRPEDVKAVLAELDGAQRRTVEGLLASYRGVDTAKADLAAVAHESFSLWLQARLKGDQEGAGKRRGETFSMTPGALAALRTCAALLSAPSKPGAP